MKLHKSQLSTGLLLGLAAAFVAGPSNADAASHSDRIAQDVQACVAEIGKRADYDEAVRATHWVARLQQRNLAELSIEIETVVYVGSTRVRSYKTRCVTDPSHNIVKFRMTPIDRGER